MLSRIVGLFQVLKKVIVLVLQAGTHCCTRELALPSKSDVLAPAFHSMTLTRA